MRRTAILAAVVGGLFASSSFAALTFSLNRIPANPANGPGYLAPGTFDSIQLIVKDTAATGDFTWGGGNVDVTTSSATGIRFRISSGSADFVTPDSAILDENGDPTGAFNTAGRTAATRQNRSYFSVTPDKITLNTQILQNSGGTEIANFGNYADADWTAGGAIGKFLTVSTSGQTISQAQLTGSGLVLGAFLVERSANVALAGGIDDLDSNTPTFAFSLASNVAVSNVAPTVSVAPTTLTVDVSPVGLESSSTVLITGNDSDGTIASLVRSGAAGALADNIVETGTNPKSFSLAGLNYTDIGTYTFTYTATDNGGLTGTNTLVVQIVPEPASLGLIGLAGLGMIRRRK